MISVDLPFVCIKCGYEKKYRVGDCLTTKDLVKKCPKCDGVMVNKREINK
jgi:NAD-dependent SIR2 family protein deacetylase